MAVVTTPDYEIYQKSFVFETNAGSNTFSIVDKGPSYGVGMTVDNVEFYEIQGSNWETINTDDGQDC